MMDLIPLDDDDLPLMRAVVTGSGAPVVSADPGNALKQRDDGLFVPVAPTSQQMQALQEALADLIARVEELESGAPPGPPVVSTITASTVITADTTIQGTA